MTSEVNCRRYKLPSIKKADGRLQSGHQNESSKKATVICFTLMVYQQFCGINAVTFYTQEIFLAAGSDLEPHWCVIILGIVQVCGNIVCLVGH
ncbi:unnamed protein product [Acanthoscelides obtectus]|uniref:Uncharacterized protein n=1 Tax=Acanthoscelides obtectus TaxID=200917 RepID=A0A9P0VQ73_ACAOB|nr:unnamed protein product [Acanthoscelides obtectus]CAK1682611.1 Facilitated trehalose transporter Tret1 [Acanthoscelides obtectus]